uniref:Uncharacterized protein n=1 Tax=Helianthus annuus TaxID=4232 RepID=A0A251TMB6_HELAN
MKREERETKREREIEREAMEKESRVYVTEAEQMTARVSRLIPMTAVKVASPVAT